MGYKVGLIYLFAYYREGLWVAQVSETSAMSE